MSGSACASHPVLAVGWVPRHGWASLSHERVISCTNKHATNTMWKKACSFFALFTIGIFFTRACSFCRIEAHRQERSPPTPRGGASAASTAMPTEVGTTFGAFGSGHAQMAELSELCFEMVGDGFELRVLGQSSIWFLWEVLYLINWSSSYLPGAGISISPPE